jgi:hypothetical protein
MGPFLIPATLSLPASRSVIPSRRHSSFQQDSPSLGPNAIQLSTLQFATNS